MRAKTVIIGGGAVGLSIALHSARRADALKDPVMLLESGDIGSGPAARSGAVLHQFHGSLNTAGMARDSLRYYQGIQSRTGRSLGFVQTGVLTLAKSRTPQHLEKLKKLVQLHDSMGIEVRCLDASAMRTLVPGLTVSDDAIGAWEPTAGCLDAHLSIEALCTLARNRGAIVRARTPVQRIVIEEGRVTGVETVNGRITCDQVVIAAGPWSGRLLKPLGIKLPLQGVRAEHGFIGSTDHATVSTREGGAYAHAGPEDSGATGFYSDSLRAGNTFEDEVDDHFDQDSTPLRANHPVLIDPEQGFYVRCDPLHSRALIGRRGRAGFLDIEDPDKFQDRVGEDFTAWARVCLEARLPIYADVHDVGAESGMFTMTPDNQPLLGAVASVPGMYVACAFSGHSFTLAPSVGEGMAQMLNGEPVSAFDTEVFSPQRYLN